MQVVAGDVGLGGASFRVEDLSGIAQPENPAPTRYLQLTHNVSGVAHQVHRPQRMLNAHRCWVFGLCSFPWQGRTIVDMNEKRVAPKAENLSPGQCWKLLSETSIGRLAVTVDGHPDVFPVNYRVDGESLIFRTGGGTKIDALRADARVAVEADAVSAEFGLAWSVVVKGRAEIAAADDEVLNATKQGMFPWQGVGKDHLVRVVAEEVTGKRFTLDASMSWRIPLDDAIRAGLE